MSTPVYGMSNPGAKTLTWSFVLNRTYSLYAKNFWTYFRIAIIPAIAAYVFSYFAHTVSRQLLRSGIFPLLSWKRVALAIGIGWVEGAVYWSISAFFFAAIAASFDRSQSNDMPALADAYTLPRKRLGAILTVALFTCLLFYLGRALSGLAVYGFFGRSDLLKKIWIVAGIIDLLLLLLAALLSKFGLAIPELMHNLTLSSRSALKRSLKQTEGWELFFMMFLVKSAILGYGAYWIAGQGLDWLWRHSTMNVTAYSWIEWIIYICIAAALESPLFIAFCVLHEELPKPDYSQCAVPLTRFGDPETISAD